jgi:integrase
MVEAGLCRRTVNQRIARVVRAFHFGVEHEMVPVTIHQALKAVPGLRTGRSAAKENRVVTAVPDAHVDAVLPWLSRQLRAAIELLRLTGARAGEILAMRTEDIDRSGPVWWYTPVRHKTRYRGKIRRVPIGPRAQEFLRPWLRSQGSEPLFQPREDKEEFLAERGRSRKTPLTPSQRARRRKPAPTRAPGELYETRTLYHAVVRGCEKSGTPRWHPHQLRHKAAT